MPALSEADTGGQGILVLGIGNLLWADEGFGVRAVQALHRHWCFPDHVRLLDGGTQGYNLLGEVRAAERLIVFDAIDYGLAPGTLRLLLGHEVPRLLGAKKLSLHQTGFQEVLAMAQLLGWQPAELVLIGVQPADIEDYGGDLTAIVGGQVETALKVALDCLQGWGVMPRLRADGEPEPLTAPGLEFATVAASAPWPW